MDLVLLISDFSTLSPDPATATPGTSSSTASRITGRPITLVGYGMGARLIFHCLETLAAEGGVEARGIVENAVLIGEFPRMFERSHFAKNYSQIFNTLFLQARRSAWT